MQNFTNHGIAALNDLSQRYGLSQDAVTHMLFAVSNGGGTMAQFNCPELGGGGQWMQGGMTMVGDMFNHGLKNTVDNLCGELSNLLYNQNAPIFAPIKRRPAAPYGQQQQSQGGHCGGPNSIEIPGGAFGNWWQADLGIASSTGGQNNIRYAVFPQTHRLAIEINGSVTIYDTLDHQIGGVSQQQSGDASMSFTSQYGLIYVSQLPVVSIDGQSPQTPTPQNAPEPAPAFAAPDSQEPQPNPPLNNGGASDSGFEQDIFQKIESLAALQAKGILSDEEFSSKKAELLARL